MRVALIDDNEIDIFVNRKLLETANTGADILAFHDPISALEGLASQKVDVIIVDNQMPELSGYEFLEKILEAQFHTEAKMIVLTATVRQDLTDKYHELNDQIILWEKPLNVEKLTLLLS